MKKMKFDQIPDSLGKVLTPEEMKAISMDSNSQGNCKCTLHMTDGSIWTDYTYSYYKEACQNYCERRCEDYDLTPRCYSSSYEWTESTGSGSETGSGSSSSGSGSGSNDNKEPLCLCTKDCTFVKNCKHRIRFYDCDDCYCQERCNWYKKYHTKKP